MDGIDILVGADSTTWREVSTSSVKTLPTRDMRSIAIRYHTWSTIKGFGIGAVLGAGVGGWVSHNSVGDKTEMIEVKFAAYFTYMAEAAAIGAVVGAAAYGVIGDKDEYFIVAQ